MFVVALGIAVLAAQVFHVSVALGAFFAGLVVGQSRFGPQAAADMTPFRDVFSALFFVSVGMLFNPGYVLAHPFMVHRRALAIVLIVKPLVALAIVDVIRDARGTAATVAVGPRADRRVLVHPGDILGKSLSACRPKHPDALVVAAISF